MSCKRLFLVDYNFKKFADTEEADGCILNGGWVSTQIIFLRAGITLLIFVRTTTGIFFFFFTGRDTPEFWYLPLLTTSFQTPGPSVTLPDSSTAFDADVVGQVCGAMFLLGYTFEMCHEAPHDQK